MSRAIMSPPITPPERDAGSTVDDLRVKEISPSRVDGSSVLKRSESLLSIAKGPLKTLLSRFKELEADMLRNLSSSNLTKDASLDAFASEKYAKFLATTLLVLEEIDAEDNVEFALSNRDIAPAVNASVTEFRHKLAQSLSSTQQNELSNHTNSDPNNLRHNIETLWANIETLLAKIKIQVTASSDWVDCQDSLEAIDHEERELRSNIFLMQEQRHVAVPALSVDLDVLATILEDSPEGENTGTPGKKVHEDGLSQWDREISETIMRLTSKISPLKASLSMFAPRLDAFANRAQGQFPSAVSALSARYTALSSAFDALIADFKKLRGELAEDKWMAVFRQVNKQASEMMNSLERTLKKLDLVSFNSPEAANLMTSFDMKNEHYGRSVPAVLAIMQRGARDRATLNGEILRGYDLLTRRWAQLSIDLADMARRMQGARNAGVVFVPGRLNIKGNTTHKGEEGRPVKGTPRLLQVPSLSSSPRHLSPRRSRNADQLTDPSSLSRSMGATTLQRSQSPSPAVFRKDTSLDPPRSRSRMGYSVDRKSIGIVDPRPPWNAGTAIRTPSSATNTPTRPSSRIATMRPGAASSLGLSRSHTPSAERRLTGSLLPTKSPPKSAFGTASLNLPPPVPATPSQATIDRLSRPKVAPLGIGLSKLPPIPMTPSGLRSSLARPKTPTSIPMSRRMVSNPEATPSRPRTASHLADAMTARSGSVLGNRRQSGIPMPSPKKSLLPVGPGVRI